MIDTSKPLELLYNSSSPPENCRFIGLNDLGKIVMQLPPFSGVAIYMTFEHSGIGTYSPQHLIRNVKKKTKVYYWTFYNTVSKTLYTCPKLSLDDSPVKVIIESKEWALLEHFEREVEL